MHLFGQILAALYQEDIVEEDDIRAWHRLGETKTGIESDSNLQKCWMIGTKMIEQFDAQESSESESEGEKATPKTPAFVPKAMESEDDSDSESSRDNTEGTGTDGGESASEEASEETSTGEGSSTEDEESEDF